MARSKYLTHITSYYKTLWWLFSIALLIVCCKTTHPLTKSAAIVPTSPLAPVKSDVAIARKKWPGTTLLNLSDGYTIYNSKCFECHDDKSIPDYSVDEWNVILRKMGRKAKLDTLQFKLVQRYILTKREALLAPRR